LRLKTTRALAAALFAAAALPAVAAGPQPPKPAPDPAPVAPAQAVPANIDKTGVLILVRTAIIALDQANKTGNYSVLRDLGAPPFQVNTPADLAAIFAPQRQQKLDLAGVSALEPQLTLLPQIEPNGMLHLAGFFPSVPQRVNFEFLYAPIDRQWRIFGISVNVSSGAPEAPPTVPVTPPKPVKPAKPEPPPIAPSTSVTSNGAGFQ
jgi:hypothetical protein